MFNNSVTPTYSLHGGVLTGSEKAKSCININTVLPVVVSNYAHVFLCAELFFNLNGHPNTGVLNITLFMLLKALKVVLMKTVHS